MAAANPDFLSRVEDNRNRFVPTQKDVTRPKNQARLQEKRKAYWNENISLRLVPPPRANNNERSLPPSPGTKDGALEPTVWNIPRFRLTERFLSDTVNRGRDSSLPMLLVSHLFDRNTASVILPRGKDMQVQCRAFPVVYDVYVHLAGGITQGGVLAGEGDSYYNGDMIFHITNVPRSSVNKLYNVASHDVHRWFINGAISTVESIQIGSDKVKSLRDIMQKLETDLKNVHNAPIFNEHGRASVGEDLKDARETRFKFLQEEKKATRARLENAMQSLEAARAKHFSACSLQITELNDENNTPGKETTSLSFSVTLTGGKRKEYYTNLITTKSDWNTVPMFATGDSDDTKSNKLRQKRNHANNDGNKNAMIVINEEDEKEHFVDVGTVSMVILPDGYGTLESYHESDPFATGDGDGKLTTKRGHHCLFHGYFRKGEYHDGTLHTDKGIFTGSFVSNQPSQGKMKYADGDVLEGAFGFPPENKHGLIPNKSEAGQEYVSPLGPNPYQRSLPHGNVRVQYKDGASYEGEMCHGSITGKGTYRFPTNKT